MSTRGGLPCRGRKQLEPLQMPPAVRSTNLESLSFVNVGNHMSIGWGLAVVGPWSHVLNENAIGDPVRRQ
jgi:hypothetical protein